MYKNRNLTIKKLIRVLSSIGKSIEYRIDRDLVSFYRDQTMFGKLHQEKLYLLNLDRELVEVNHKLLYQERLLKQEVCKAYDIARK